MRTPLEKAMKTITVATYNICHGHYSALNWNRLGAVIRESGADLLGLQEVDMYTARIGGVDSLKRLSEASGMPYAHFVPAMDYDGGQYGTAILSRFPIGNVLTLPLPCGQYEPRSFGCLTVYLGEGDRLTLLNTHLSYESQELQTVQASFIRAWVDENLPPERPAFITGDFNTDNLNILSPILQAGFIPINTPTATHLTFRPEPTAIDNILYQGKGLSPLSFGMIDNNASDHNLLWCRFLLT